MIPSPAMLRLCHADEVPEGAARGFLPAPGAPHRVIVLRRGGALLAFADSCPHYSGGTPMAWRTDAYLSADGQHLECYAHGALFDIETGNCVSGPCLGRRLTRIPLHVEEDGTILVPEHVAGSGGRKR